MAVENLGGIILMEKNKIILSADTELQDNQLREWVSKIHRKLENLNDRTVRQTGQISELRNRIKELEK